ncbi:MAG: hypothetical protein ACRCU5_14165 [Rhizobiaceae bacterium]
MMTKGELGRRAADDVIRFLALIICLAPVASFCFLYIFAYTISSAGGAPPPLNEVRDGLRDIVLLIIGGASGVAFGRRSSVQPPDMQASKE